MSCSPFNTIVDSVQFSQQQAMSTPYHFAPPSTSIDMIPAAPPVFAPSSELPIATIDESGAEEDCTGGDYDDAYPPLDENQIIKEINMRSWCDPDDPVCTLTNALKRVRIMVTQIHDIRQWMYALPEPSNPLASALALPIRDLVFPETTNSNATLFDTIKPIAEALAAAETAFAGIADILPSSETCKVIRERLRTHLVSTTSTTQ